MLLARLFDWAKGREKSQIFMLEILAVFIGITASLFVDDWRQRAQDREILDQLLSETHYNALQSRAYFLNLLGTGQVSIESTQLLGSGDLGNIPDRELAEHFARALRVDWAYHPQPGFERLRNTTLSIPFDHTMAELDDLFHQLNAWGDDYNDIRKYTVELSAQVNQMVNVRLDPNRVAHALTNRSAERMAELNSMVEVEGDQRLLNDEAESIRKWSRSPQGAAALRELIRLRYLSSVNLIYMMDRNESVIDSIRLYDPDISLPIETIGLAGDATSLGWDTSIPMRRDPDDPNLWRATVELADGELKFRADDNWSTNWGAPKVRGDSLSFSFRGDAAAVFPRGAGEFQGLNIPVEAGRYDVTFNSQSFEYSFDKVSGGE
jgi:hypothetical protein